ncbi:hypothetical protein OXX69_005006 [Metschnikowia pulcherrima]
MNKHKFFFPLETFIPKSKQALLYKPKRCNLQPFRGLTRCTAHQFHTLTGNGPKSANNTQLHAQIRAESLYFSDRNPSKKFVSRFAASRTYASRKFTRQERINEARYTAQSNLDKIDAEYEIFTKKVTKVVDVGSAPGTWLRHTRNRLSQIHNMKHEELHKMCTVIGVDLLFCQPPKGTFFTQGNIYSQNTHTQVEHLLKESAFRLLKQKSTGHSGTLDNSAFSDMEVSYIQKEANEAQLDASLSELAGELGDLALTESNFDILKHTFQADLVLSDLGTTPLQESGFHNNTLSKPFIRSSQNKMLRLPWDFPEKASIDMAEAALLLCGSVLTKGGTFVVRLSMVDLSDPELELLEKRLSLVFESVSRWSDNGRTHSDTPRHQNLFMICENKRDHMIDKYEVFGVTREPRV